MKVIEALVPVLMLAVGGTALVIGYVYFVLVGRHKVADWKKRNRRRLRLSLLLAERRLIKSWLDHPFLGSPYSSLLGDVAKDYGRKEDR